jgi:hypothetical protein
MTQGVPREEAAWVQHLVGDFIEASPENRPRMRSKEKAFQDFPPDFRGGSGMNL